MRAWLYCKGAQGEFWGVVPYLDWGDGYMSEDTCENYLYITLKIGVLYANYNSKIYFKK